MTSAFHHAPRLVATHPLRIPFFSARLLMLSSASPCRERKEQHEQGGEQTKPKKDSITKAESNAMPGIHYMASQASKSHTTLMTALPQPAAPLLELFFSSPVRPWTTSRLACKRSSRLSCSCMCVVNSLSNAALSNVPTGVHATAHFHLSSFLSTITSARSYFPPRLISSAPL